MRSQIKTDMSKPATFVISTQAHYYGDDASEEYAERAAATIAQRVRSEYDVPVQITSEFQPDNDPDIQQWVNDNWMDWL